jgi:hypothetical protein
MASLQVKKRRAYSCMFPLPDDVQLAFVSMLDPISLTRFELVCVAASRMTEASWAFLLANYFQATLSNPPALDPLWTARTKFRYLMHFEDHRRPHWALRMSTHELVEEMAALRSNADAGFWADDASDDEDYVDDLCQMLQNIVPGERSTSRYVASVDMPFNTYVALFVAHAQELAQRGIVADPWMLRTMQVGDIVDHLDLVGVRRDFWRVMDIANGHIMLQPLGVSTDAQGRWTSFPRLVSRSQMCFDYYMSSNQSAGRGLFTMPVWHTEHRRQSWDFSLMMVYGNDIQ